MGFDKSVEKEIKRRANAMYDEIGEEEIYRSPGTGSYLTTLAGTLTGSYTSPLKVLIMEDGRYGFTANTNGQEIRINYQHEIAARYSTKEARFDAFMGMFFHEMAHALYCDFATDIKAVKSIESGRLFGPVPETENDEEQQWLDEIINYLGDVRMRKIFANLFSGIMNCIDDRHDEDSMMSDHPSLTVSGIKKVRESLLMGTEPYEKELEDLKSGKADRLSLILGGILQYSRFGKIFMYDESLTETDEILKYLKGTFTVIEDAVCEDDTVKRYGYANLILLKLWPVIKETIDEIKKNDNSSSPSGNSSGKGTADDGNSMPGTGNGQVSDETVQKIAEAISGAMTAAAGNMPSVAPRPDGQTGGGMKKSPLPAGNVKTQPASGSDEDNTSAILSQIRADAACSRAEKEMDEEIANATAEKIETVSQNSTHEGITLFAVRHTDGNALRCSEITERIRPYTKRLAEEMKRRLRELQDGGTDRHRQFGRTVVPGDAYRPDGRYFAKKNLPQDISGMAISVLVDNSGSMCGRRIESAREAALMVYDFATEIDVPVSVSGHTTHNGGVKYITYADYERAGKKDRERIADMEAHACNRDGMALEIAANLLSRRPEEHKLLIIISDGQPNDHGYGGEEAAEDIRSIVRRYRRKDIEIVAAAIGDDKEMIRGIYGESFIDISDLARLPKQMTGIVYERMKKCI